MRTPHKFLWSGIVLALLAAALFSATPALPLFRIHRAVERSDAEAVSHHVDFDLLRESVRAKLDRAGLIARLGADNVHASLADFARAESGRGRQPE